MRVTIESSEGRPWVVLVVTDDGVSHRFVRSDDAAANALECVHDGYARGWADGTADAASVSYPEATTED